MTVIKYRLVWFQHFHKAAGTSVIDTARLNNETFWPQHDNANPLDANGQAIKVWKYSADHLTQFIDQCQSTGVTFVATEWGMPNIEILSADPRVTLITCLRNPLIRYLSNFYFDLHLGFTHATSPETYRNTRERAITMDNYYCRLLAGHNNNPEDINPDHYLKAQAQLAKFDCAVSLESGIDTLYQYLAWTPSSSRANQSSNTLGQKINLLLRGQWRLLYYRLRFPKRTPSITFSDDFEQRNCWDYKLLADLERPH